MKTAREKLLFIASAFPLLSLSAATMAVLLPAISLWNGTFGWALLPAWVISTLALAVTLRVIVALHFIATAR